MASKKINSDLAIDGKITAGTWNGAIIQPEYLNVTGAPVNGLSIASGKIFTVNNTLTLNGTDSTTHTLPASTGTLVNEAGTATLTNKKIVNRTFQTTSASSLSSVISDFNAYDCIDITALATALSIDINITSAQNFDKKMLRIKDNGSSQTLSFNSSYIVACGVTLPTSTTAGKWLYLGFVYNSTITKWQCIAMSKEV